MKNTSYTLQASSLAFLVIGMLFAVAVMVAPQSAKAADLFGGGDWVTDSVTPFYGFDSGFSGGTWVTDSVTPFYDYGFSGGNWVTDSVTPFYDSGFSNFSSMPGGWSYPVSSFGGTPGNTNYNSQNQAQSQSSNNTNVNNNVITINTPTQQTPVCPNGTTGVYPNCVYPQPVTPTYDICPNIPGVQATLPVGYVIQYGNCQYQTIYPTPTPAPQPYVTLSQVPYTGLELGPVGTALYWGFLVLWCLMAAYLIAVKKVQNKVVAWFSGSAAPSHTAHAVHAPVAHAPVVKAAAPFSGIDPFIQGQINRASK